MYACRLACAMLLMEVMSHTLYFSSIAKHKLWQRYGTQLHLSAVDMGMTGFWVLMFMWLKVRYALQQGIRAIELLGVLQPSSADLVAVLTSGHNCFSNTQLIVSYDA